MSKSYMICKTLKVCWEFIRKYTRDYKIDKASSYRTCNYNYNSIKICQVLQASLRRTAIYRMQALAYMLVEHLLISIQVMFTWKFYLIQTIKLFASIFYYNYSSLKENIYISTLLISTFKNSE